MLNSLAAISREEGGLGEYLAKIERIPFLSLERENELAVKWCNGGDVQAAHELVVSHLKLVVKVARKFYRYGLPLMDLISEGNIGLMQAVKKFDLMMKCRLSTYALWWIRASIQSYILKSWSLLKVGTSELKRQLFSGLHNVKSKIYNSTDDEPEEQNVNNSNELSVHGAGGYVRRGNISDHMRCAKHVVQLDHAVSADGGVAPIDMIQREGDVTQEFALIETEQRYMQREIMKRAIGSLTERERAILLARRLQDKPLTLGVLAARYGISGERIRQIEEHAVRKLSNFAQKEMNAQDIV